jgi:hypothetical protein
MLDYVAILANALTYLHRVCFVPNSTYQRRLMKYRTILLLVCLCSSPACAEVIVDQEHFIGVYWGYILDYPGDYIAQTFTVRNTGQLTGIGVQVVRTHSSGLRPVTDDLLVRLIRTDSSGVPMIDEVLASHEILRSQIPIRSDFNPMLEIDLSSLNLRVEEGERLAIAISSDHTYYAYQPNYLQYSWVSTIQDPHPGGEFFIYSPLLYGPIPHLVSDQLPRPTRDMGFRVLVDAVPEPSSIALVLIGVVSVGRLRVREPSRCRLVGP